jgi:hypothetical protein
VHFSTTFFAKIFMPVGCPLFLGQLFSNRYQMQYRHPISAMMALDYNCIYMGTPKCIVGAAMIVGRRTYIGGMKKEPQTGKMFGLDWSFSS